MTLYLSSDEKTLDNSNTRTKFKNSILPDFLVNDSFNLKLHEIFFDSKFPTLVNFEYPHIITTVIRNEHKLQDFPEKFQNNSMFKYLLFVVNYLFLLQLKALFHDFVYLHGRALSSQPTPFQVLKIKTIKTTNLENKDESTPLSLSCKTILCQIN